MAFIVYIALGTNIGNRLANLQAALTALHPIIDIKAKSAIYQTEPWGYTEQPAFLNMVIHAKTDLSPFELLSHLKNLELTLGRTPTFLNGPRLIDLDILFYDELIIDTKGLMIPHPRLHERGLYSFP
jgi:2-amino-4-hydroxy-6-hydroxymethyldihydropteridine diphosphokinase